MTQSDELSVVDRTTMAIGTKLSRRSLFKGGLFGLAGFAGLMALPPIEASACTGCHYCVSGCTSCNNMICCSYNTGSCQVCPSTCPLSSYIKDYVCDNFCDYWCATSPC